MLSMALGLAANFVGGLMVMNVDFNQIEKMSFILLCGDTNVDGDVNYQQNGTGEWFNHCLLLRQYNYYLIGPLGDFSVILDK